MNIPVSHGNLFLTGGIVAISVVDLVVGTGELFPRQVFESQSSFYSISFSLPALHFVRFFSETQKEHGLSIYLQIAGPAPRNHDAEWGEMCAVE